MNTRENGEVQSDVVGRHAVVLGGSLAGLLGQGMTSASLGALALQQLRSMYQCMNRVI